MSTIPIGSTDSARRAQAVIVVDRATGEPAAAGAGAGTSDTTEATQLLVKTAVESIASDGATEATQLEVAGNTDRAADALEAMQGDSTPVAVDIGQSDYETVAASSTAQTLGATGAVGDYLAGLLVIPATTGAGAVTLLDNATSIPVFVTGTLPSLIPFFIPLGIKSVSGAWKVTTGANVSVVAVGEFT